MTTISVETQTEPIDTQCTSKINPRVPDPKGCRYCTMCKDWLPLENFPSGKRRYSCKKHRWEQFGKRAKRKHMANTENKLIWTLWIKAYSDSKLFQSIRDQNPTNPVPPKPMRVNISQKEIELLLFCMVKTLDITSTMCTMIDDLTDLGKRIAIVPISPTEVVSLSNAALVPSTRKRQLFKAFRANGLQGYTSTLRIIETQINIVYRPSTEQLCEMQETLVSKNRRLLREVE
jgi:hypothetical protein